MGNIQPWYKTKGAIYTIVATFLIGVLIGASAGGTDVEPVDSTVGTGEIILHNDETTPVVSDSEPKGPLKEFGNGVWEVGVDIAPGKYKSTTNTCYYARLSSLSGGGTSNIIENNNVDGPVTIEILPTDVGFESNRCRWKMVE